MTKPSPTLTIILVLFVFSSCTTYTIPLSSFRQQFGRMDSLTAVGKATPGWSSAFHGGKDSFLIHSDWPIHCWDNKGREVRLKGGPSVEFRFTYGPDGKRVILFFDTMFVTDSLVTGQRSRILSKMRSSIPLNSITKIELQETHKHYVYGDGEGNRIRTN